MVGSLCFFELPEEGMMKISASAMVICLTLFLLCGGCSREEPPPPPAKSAKVEPVRKPIPEHAEVSLPGKEAQPGDEAEGTEDREIASLEEALKALGPVAGEEKTPVKDIIRHHEPKPVPGPTETSATGETEKPVAEAEKAVSAEISALEHKEPKTPVLDVGKEVEKMETMPGYYVVWEADTLPAIAARQDVFGDPLKWPVLYRLNMEMLGALDLEDDFFKTKVPAGFRLKIVTPEEAKANLKKQIRKNWVVNVLSTTAEGEIPPLAIRLMKNGYKVYIARAKIKGKDWMRLRVGFFGSLAEGNREEEKMRPLVNLGDLWVTKADKKELDEFASF
jgi:hypothetical protein